MHIQTKKISNMEELRQAFALTECSRILQSLQAQMTKIEEAALEAMKALGIPPQASVRRIDLKGEEIHYVVIEGNGTGRPSPSLSGKDTPAPGPRMRKLSGSTTKKSSKDTSSSDSAQKAEK